MFLRRKERDEIRARLRELQNPVTIVNFTQRFECVFTRETRRMLEEVADLSNLLTLRIHDFTSDAQEVKRFGIERIPATAILGDHDYGIRLYGMPGGFQFPTLLDDLLMVSQRDSGLQQPSRDALTALRIPIAIEVFVSTISPYGPREVHFAHQFAMESEYVSAAMIETTEFPELAQKRNVFSVPKTVVNRWSLSELALSENQFLHQILQVSIDGSGSYY